MLTIPGQELEDGLEEELEELLEELVDELHRLFTVPEELDTEPLDREFDSSGGKGKTFQYTVLVSCNKEIEKSQ